MIRPIVFEANGAAATVSVEPIRRLADVLRDELGLTGTKIGCNAGDCGACTVLLDGRQVCACLTALGQVAGRSVTTVEGLGTADNPGPMQRAFIEEQAAQCGFCMNGIIMNAKVLLDKNPRPSVADIKQSLSNVLCRCGSHARVIRAIRRAATEKA